jgi:hypothetical protein
MAHLCHLYSFSYTPIPFTAQAGLWSTIPFMYEPADSEKAREDAQRVGVRFSFYPQGL